jgi:hypothetical protein
MPATHTSVPKSTTSPAPLGLTTESLLGFTATTFVLVRNVTPSLRSVSSVCS